FGAGGAAPRVTVRAVRVAEAPGIAAGAFFAFPDFASMWSLPTARRAIIAGGCFGTIYTQLTTSPATIQFAKELHGGGWHIGILGALPQAMLVFQFLAAMAASHLRCRRWAWLCACLV